MSRRPSVAEFFAGMGLVRIGLESEGFEVLFANDVDRTKQALYEANFGEGEFRLADIRDLSGDDIPDVDLATASFPCTDLSLAGNRAGLAGDESGLFWKFAEIIEEMGDRKPTVILLENVLGFATSNDGADLRSAIARLNSLGYWCDPIVLDAAWFVPQSRQRLFVVCSQNQVGPTPEYGVSAVRPTVLRRALQGWPDLKLQALDTPAIVGTTQSLSSIVERLAPTDERWWDTTRVAAFIASLSDRQLTRVEQLRDVSRVAWRTAYRRTRDGVAVWEVRSDDIAGALRTAKGGSSKQALVEMGEGDVRVRWMLPSEYARLQGAPDVHLDSVSEAKALYALGDAVCVPAISWIARHHLKRHIRPAEDDIERSA